MIFVYLFISFLNIGAFSFGGGYAALPLIQHQVVDIYQWLTTSQLSDLVTISQMTPGPIAINAATFVGMKVAGLSGAIVATIGCVLPSCLFVTILARFYLKYRQLDFLQKVFQYLRPAVVSLIATAGLSILMSAFFPKGIISLSQLEISMVVIFIICCYLLMYKKCNPIFVMVLSGILYVLQYFLISLI